MTRAELDAMLARNPQVTINENYLDTRLLAAKPEQLAVPSLDDNASCENKSVVRPLVRFTLRRARLLDRDNAYGAIKALLDGCQASGLIVGDSEEQIELEVHQEKVSRLKDQKTIIHIDYENH